MSLVAEVNAQEIARLLSAIDAQAPAGLFDVEDETYQAIDQEMVKLGGLQEATIDWVYIEEASRQYLGQQCKHLRIVAHLSAAWLRSACWERWALTLTLLAGMVERYWETAYPKPGPKGYLGKRKLVGLVLNRLNEALPRLDRFTYSPAHAAGAQQALLRLQQLQAVALLDDAMLDDMARLLRKHSERASGAGEPAAARASAPVIKPAPLAEVIATPMPRVSLGNERESRRAVLSMAELINQQDPYDPTGYQLRRFGLWAHIQAAPQAGQGHRTELMAVPLEIAGDYEEAIAGSVFDAALLQRIEKACRLAPSGYAAASLRPPPPHGWQCLRWPKPSAQRLPGSSSVSPPCSSCASATARRFWTTSAWPGSKAQASNRKLKRRKSSWACAKNLSASWKAVG